MKQGDLIRCKEIPAFTRYGNISKSTRKNLKRPEDDRFFRVRLWDNNRDACIGFFEYPNLSLIIYIDLMKSDYIEVIASSGIRGWVLRSLVEIVE